MCSFPHALRNRIAALLGVTLLTASSWAAPTPRPQFQITGYVISADLDPAVHRLTATAAVTFTALEDLNKVTFELNNGLQLNKLTEAKNMPLQSERLTTNSTGRVALDKPLAKGSTNTFNFEY